MLQNAHVLNGWNLTPAISRSVYPDGKEVRSVTKVESAESADGYHAESPKGFAVFVSFWDDDSAWRWELLEGKSPRGFLRDQSASLQDLMDKLALREQIWELQSRLDSAYGGR